MKKDIGFDLIYQIKKIFNRKKPMSMDEFLRITMLKYDEQNYIYYIVNPFFKDNKIWQLEASMVWEAKKEKTLKQLAREIIKRVNAEFPTVYKNYGLNSR